MKFRKSRPFIAACMGRMIAHSPPKKPAASPEKKLDAASAHSSAVIRTPSKSADLIIMAASGADRARDRHGAPTVWERICVVKDLQAVVGVVALPASP